MLSRWAFRFLLWYICILFTQPQNRFWFLYPLHIADICVIASLGLHLLSALQDGRPLVRFGPGTNLALFVLVGGLISQYAGALQTNTAWNGFIEILVKSVLVLIMVEAMCYSVQRVWAVQATIMFAALWWVKAGLRLSAAGATYAGDRIMGPAVSLVENPNGFAYMMCVIIPIFLYFYQQWKHKYLRLGFLALAFAGIYIVFQTGSRTGMMILIIVGVFLAIRYFWQYKLTLVLSAVVIMQLFSSVGYLNVQRFKSIPDSIKGFFTGEEATAVEEMNQDQQSAFERKQKNRHTWALIKLYPVFGVGINPDESKFPAGLWGATGQVHNELLMVGKQMGFFGIILYLLLLRNMFWHGWNSQRRTASWWPAASDLGWTFKLQAIVFAVGGQFSPLPWNAPLMIISGAASALWACVQNLDAKEQAAAGTVPASAPASVTLARAGNA